MDAVIGGTFPGRNMIASQKNEDLNLPRSITLPYTSLDTMSGVTIPATGAAISAMSKMFYIASLDAVEGGTFSDRSILAAQNNEDLNLPRSVITADTNANTPTNTPTNIASRSTIGQRKSYTSDEID